MAMRIREIIPEDAGSFLELARRVDAESDYMLMEAGERNISLGQQRRKLEQMEQDGHSTILVAENMEKELVGYLAAFSGNARRTRHSAYLVIGIVKEYHGQGIGTRLFQELEKWAVKQGTIRLELTVVCQNQAAIALYEKMGFRVEGTKRASLMINGTPQDELMMSKLLESES